MHTKELRTEILKPVEVALANLPWKQGDSWGVRAGSRWPHIKNKGEETYVPFPFFLAYTAAVLLRQGIRARVVDAIAETLPEDAFAALIQEAQPRLFVAEVSTPSLENDLAILRNIKRTGAKIAVCGMDFNIQDPLFLEKNDFIDYVMVGEYEYTTLELYEHIKSGVGLETIAGLVYRDDTRIRANPPRGTIDDLDALPWPAREGLPMDRYVDAPGNLKTPSVQMLSSRGCPFGCTFCAWPQLIYRNNRYRRRHPRAVVDEMEYLTKTGTFKSVYFDDDTFNINASHVLGICEEIRRRRLVVPWAAMARADLMDETVLTAMRQAGLHSVKYGVESADQGFLDEVDKHMDLAKAERMIRLTKTLGIKVHLSFVFGMPGETQESIHRTIDYAMSLEPDTVQFSILTPYPGTAYYRRLQSQGDIVSQNWSDYNGASKSVIKTATLTPGDLEKARQEALAAWRKYRRSKKTIMTMPFDKELRLAFRNNIKNNGAARTLIKTARYIAGI
jgi:anaerobic magnesium-protoporphyrin IX monomethyl ester cyclase